MVHRRVDENRAGDVMAVYVDFGKIPYGRMLMSHMLADSEEELLAMADTIGVARKWIQRPKGKPVHFDICQSKRALAVKNGAREIGRREFVELMRKQRAG